MISLILWLLLAICFRFSYNWIRKSFYSCYGVYTGICILGILIVAFLLGDILIDCYRFSFPFLLVTVSSCSSLIWSISSSFRMVLLLSADLLTGFSVILRSDLALLIDLLYGDGSFYGLLTTDLDLSGEISDCLLDIDDYWVFNGRGGMLRIDLSLILIGS